MCITFLSVYNCINIFKHNEILKEHSEFNRINSRQGKQPPQWKRKHSSTHGRWLSEPPALLLAEMHIRDGFAEQKQRRRSCLVTNRLNWIKTGIWFYPFDTFTWRLFRCANAFRPLLSTKMRICYWLFDNEFVLLQLFCRIR